MKIIRDRENKVYTPKNRLLGNCFTVLTDNAAFYYEFVPNSAEALILCDSLEYVEEVIQEFRFYNFHITVFYNQDHTLYRSFDPVFTFKLPIKIIQPSQFFIDEEKLKVIEEYIQPEEIFIPVTIIHDEYVCLDGHTRLFYLYKNDSKMVNVYMDKPFPYIQDFIYLAKENNIFNISGLKLLSHEEYDIYWNGFCDDYFGKKTEI